ncbi:MAG: YtxH domain-containing protein [Myxococcales bacterium]|nr:YtxH domain-containing protein [Myxococcales bacterium]
MFERARDYSESALAAIGLQPRRSASDYILPALGLFSVGVLVGAGLGLMLAPKRGVELRGELGRKVRGVGAKLRRRREQAEVAEGDNGGDDDAGDSEVLSAVPSR